MADPTAALLRSPNSGGLNVTNRNNPYGLRAYPTNGGYGGEMMPKWTGWLGTQPNTAYKDAESSEISMGDERGEFPAMTPNLSKDQLARLLALKLREPIPRDIGMTAQEFANQRRGQGLSPFKDIEDELR